MIIRRDFERKILWTTGLLMGLGTVINSVYTLISIKFTPERLKVLVNLTAIEMPILLGIVLLWVHSWFKPVTEFFDELEDKGAGKVDIKVAMAARKIASDLPRRLVFLEFGATFIIGLSAGAWMRMAYGHLSTGESVAILASTFINSINMIVLLFYLATVIRRPLMEATSFCMHDTGERKTEGIGIALKVQVTVASVMLLALFSASIMFINHASKMLETRLCEQAKQVVSNTAQEIGILKGLNVCNEKELSRLLAKTQIGEKGCSFIVDQDGQLIAGNPTPELLNAIKTTQAGVWEDVRSGCFMASAESSDWRLATAFFTSEFSAPINKMWSMLLMFTIAIIIIGNIYAYLVSRDIAIPVNDLITSSRKVAEGNLSLSVVVGSGDEIGILAIIFNRMVENLKSTMDEIHKHGALREEEKEKLHVGVLRILEAVDAADKGDLAKQIEDVGEGEIAELSRAINRMLLELRKLIGQIQNVGIHLSSASSQLFATAQELSSGSTEQASSIAEITATVEELASTSKQIAENSDSVVHVAEEALNSVQVGQDSVSDVSNSMIEIRDKVETGCKRILSLGEKSQRIGDVLEIINHIADETKLIAFNAAIEASRAGDAGKGFSVVAVEVRKLAENVVESTKTIKEIVSEIQTLANASVMATEEETKRVEQGVALSRKAGASISEILDMVDHTSKAARQISVATQQQKTASEQIVGTMHEVAEVAKQTAAGSRQTADSASQLSNLADDLKKMVGKFRLEAVK